GGNNWSKGQDLSKGQITAPLMRSASAAEKRCKPFLSSSLRRNRYRSHRLARTMPYKLGMNIRVERFSEEQRTVLRIAGRLQSADVSELDKETQSVEGPLTLDLSELMSADNAGIERLRELQAQGAEMRGASRYMQMLLDPNS
ncbi:MAG: hypothetical protein OEM63_15445, partial [Gammaproteobacteria bacterium]|nr:hypothetical protein [Gammaproteobacteria bacterium]